MPKQVMEDQSNPEKMELKKHVAVIHSSNRLTLLQRKIANALLYNAYADLMTRDDHEIHIAALCKLIGYNSNDHKTIKKALVNLLSTVLEWNLVDGDRLDTGGVWNASSIISDASIDGSVCTYSYSNKMRRLLYRPDIYAKIDMAIQARFHSSYGLALYENCNRYRAIGKTPWFELGKFRALMGVEGNKYAIFRDFKTRVMDKAIEEVNACSPILVQPLFKRENRKVTSIRFEIKNNSDMTVGEKEKQGDADFELGKRLQNQFGFREGDVATVLGKYGEAYVREKLLLVNQSAPFQTGTIRNPRQYLLTAIEKNYVKSVPKNSPEPVKPPSSEKTEASWKNNEWVDRYHRAVNVHILTQVHALPEWQYRKMEDAFSAYMLKEARGVYQNIFLKEGMKNPLIEDQFCLFVRRKMPEMLEGFATLQAWRAALQEKSGEDTERALECQDG